MAGGLLLERRFTAESKTSSEDRSYIGKRLQIPEADWRQSHLNAVLFISTKCHFCEQSTPFYRRISAISPQPARVPLSIVTYDPQETMKAFLARSQVQITTIFNAAPAVLGLTRTPTLLFVDRDGTVVRAFEGLLDSAKQQEVARIVTSGAL
jgi:thioredoxin-related protein